MCNLLDLLLVQAFHLSELLRHLVPGHLIQFVQTSTYAVEFLWISACLFCYCEIQQPPIVDPDAEVKVEGGQQL